MPKLNKVRAGALNSRGIAHILLIVLLLGGIAAGVFLVQKTQIFKPKATSENIEWVSSQADQDNCVTYKEGRIVTTCTKVKFKVTVPAQVSNSK